MHIIIDGYNLIRQSDTLRRYEKYCLEEGRQALIRFVSVYRKQKSHKITVVFDGWDGGPAEEERDRKEGIDIVYSRRGQKADDVIKRMVQSTGEEIIVVTSDRNIADFVHRRGGTAISSPEFERRIAVTKERTLNHAGHGKDEDDEMNTRMKKKGTARRLSRKKKAAIAKIRKL